MVLQAFLEEIIKDPRYHDILSLVKTARNGAVYGAKVRFPHALVMIFLFRSGTFREKLSLVLRATRHHASNLARFASIYKITLLALKYYGATPGKEGEDGISPSVLQKTPPPTAKSRMIPDQVPAENQFTGPYDSLAAGMLGGYLVFGRRSPRTGKISPVSQQIVIYIFARVALALASIAVKPGHGIPGLTEEPARSNITHYAWPAFASLSWGLVMLLFDKHPDDLQSSLRSSMVYIYRDCDSWDSLRTLLWHNK
ncbi:hypothetical protein GMORB2_6117 [Geosmithia morbida]|uniref:Peroxisomal membrane protein 4 n=1 Tax=Geosmithia morbida TaxID=1094350 RepID=A0A9P4YX97_9HYPO|nr:uncharacterized protein GMORB2_6117 [Geosmithia morbida]KAF4123416.1 hypothetical protein GMORB2_6117 [Geosmithia morbida]